MEEHVVPDSQGRLTPFWVYVGIAFLHGLIPGAILGFFFSLGVAA